MSRSTALKIDRISDRVLSATQVIGAVLVALLVAYIVTATALGVSTIAISAVVLPVVLVTTGLGLTLVIAGTLIGDRVDKALGRR